jgi:DNA-binding transcriptional regulator YiaG
MPNLGVVLREEINRLSRRTLRGGIAATKRASAQQRRDIAALKRGLGELTRQVAQLARRMPQTQALSTPPRPGTKAVRFVAKGLRSQRARLELSAADLGRLVGVSEQSVYNWEHGAARPRPAYAARLAALRNVGKREAHAQLAKLGNPKPKKRRRRSA